MQIEDVNNVLKYKILKLCMILVLLSVNFSIFSQMDPQYSANMFNWLAINPAAAGVSGQIDVTGIVRQQWVEFPDHPQTNVFGIDGRFKLIGKTDGAGISIVDDNLGLINLLTMSVNYSYRKKLFDGEFAIGISPGVSNLKWDGSKIKLVESDYHNNFGGYDLLKTSTNISVFDMGLGTFYQSAKGYAGISVKHLFSPTLALNDQDVYLFLQRHMYITAGYNIDLKNHPDYQLTPSVFYKTDGIISQIDANCNVWYKDKFLGGLTYRLQDAVVFLAGMKMKSGLMAGVAVDVTTSKMNYGTWGGFELFLNYKFDIELDKQRYKYKSIRIL